MTALLDTFILKHIISLFCYTVLFPLIALQVLPRTAPSYLEKELAGMLLPVSNRPQEMLVLKSNEVGIRQKVNIYKP